MARLPSKKLLLVEDFPAEVQSWIDKIIRPLNLFMEETVTALNKQLTYGENFLAQIKDTEVIGNAIVSGTLTLGSAVIESVSSTVNITSGYAITGTGIPVSTVVLSVSGNTITMNKVATISKVESITIGNNFPISFQYTLNVKPIGLFIVDAFEMNTGNPEIMKQALYADWEYSAGNIIINSVTGLKLQQKYSIKFIIIAG